MNFAVLWLYTRKFSPQNLGCGVLWCCKSEQSVKVFSAKIVFSPIRESFLPQKFSAIRYICQCPPWWLIIQGKWGEGMDLNVW